MYTHILEHVHKIFVGKFNWKIVFIYLFIQNGPKVKYKYQQNI